MSQENVEVVRRGYDAYARGDVAAMLADLDPQMRTYREEPDGLWDVVEETQRAKRHRRIRARGTTGQVAGAASE